MSRKKKKAADRRAQVAGIVAATFTAFYDNDDHAIASLDQLATRIIAQYAHRAAMKGQPDHEPKPNRKK